MSINTHHWYVLYTAGDCYDKQRYASMKNPYIQVGKRIRLLRKRSALTQAQLAEKADLSNNFIGLIERGESRPTLDSINKIAEVLGVKLNDFFVAEDDHFKNNKEVFKEIETLLKGRNLKDAELVLAVSKCILERFSIK